MHLRVLIYSRVSNADEINSSIGQEQICKDYLHSISLKNNFTYEIYAVFIEEPGLSGGEYYNRPLYVKMIELMNSNSIDAICVKESSRLDRNTEHSEKLRKIAEKKKILLLSRDLDYDIHSPSGQFFYTINSAKNEYERKVIGERTRLAIRNDMRKGKIHSHPIPLGFKKHPTENGQWLAIPEEISLVALIFDIFNRTISYSLTATEINGIGYKPKKGSSFSPELIKRILTNRKYLAELKVPEEELIVPLSFGEQINRTVFELAQINVKKIQEYKNSNRKAKRTSLLVNLLYSQAGNKFITTCSGKDSELYSYYRIKSEDISIPSQKIEQLVLDSIKQVKDQGEIKNYTGKIKFNDNKRVKDLNGKIQTSDKVMTKLKREKNKIFDLLLVPETRSTTLIKSAEEKIKDLDNQIDVLTHTNLQLTLELELTINDGKATSEALRSFDEEIEDALNGQNRILQRKIIRSLIKKITIDNKNMIIKIHWQIKSTPEEIIIFDDVHIPPMKRFDEIQYLLLGKTPENIESTPLFHFYVIEKHSATSLALRFGVTRSTILKYLNRCGIKRRASGNIIHRKRGINYGLNHTKNKTQKNNIELSRIEKARKLREEGMSFHKIAKLFNELNIPTKHKKSWHGRSIQQILKTNHDFK